MITFPNAKINIGLNITEKRDDGFHNIETIMYPIPLSDALEFVEADSLKFETSGLAIDGDSSQNLVLKAYRLLDEEFDLPPLHIHLYKNIPMGAGLGGGSADGAFMLRMLNDYFKLNLSTEELEQYAARLGSDCAFFIQNKVAFSHGRGELITPIDFKFSEMYLLLVKPQFGVPTQIAYRNVVPQKPSKSLKGLINLPVNQWRENVENQFEETLFPTYSELSAIKEKLYDSGAIYASMTGSGSAVYGLFDFNTECLSSRFSDELFIFASKL